MGGLSRRATLIEDLSGTRLTVDAGNFAWKSGRITEDRLPQQRRKAELQLDAFALTGIDGVAPGVGDLVLGIDWLTQAAASREVPLLLANLTCDGQAPFAPWSLVERDGLSIGLVGVLGEKRTVAGCEVSSPVEALKRAAAAMPQADLLIAMTHTSDEDDTALAEAVPEVDILLNGHARLTRDAPRSLPGAAIQLSSGSRGKKLGLAEITVVPGASGFSNAGARKELERLQGRYQERLASAKANLADPPDPGAERRAQRQVTHYTEELAEVEAGLADIAAAGDGPAHTIDSRLAPLDRKVADHAGTMALLTAAQAEIALMEGAAAVPALLDTPFIGSAACGSCHSEQLGQWLTTPHATAWQTLEAESRTADMACFSCHATGATHALGPQHPSQVTAMLQGVGCEDCHGPGRDHLAAPGPGQMLADPPEAACVRCHDGVQDDGQFVFSEYRPHIVHSEH